MRSDDVTRGVKHKLVEIDGVNVFYREAGPADAPVVLLPHGYPCSSYEFRNYMPALADRWRLLAPDFPGCVKAWKAPTLGCGRACSCRSRDRARPTPSPHCYPFQFRQPFPRHHTYFRLAYRADLEDDTFGTVAS